MTTTQADALLAVLALEGFRTELLDGGCPAAEAPSALMPHMVILDIEMPLCDGSLPLRPCTEFTEFAMAPIIADSSLKEADVMERCQNAQIDAFCRKGNTLNCPF